LLIAGVGKLRAEFFLDEAKEATTVRPVAHDRSPGVREYRGRAVTGSAVWVSRGCGGPHPAGAHREHEGAARGAFLDFGRYPGHKPLRRSAPDGCC
jgi:hypothetical protein